MDELTDPLSARRIASASDQRRRRVERAMHDGVQQQLVLAALKIALLRASIREDPAGAEALCGELVETLGNAQRELRELAHWVYPVVLENEGLIAALADAIDRRRERIELTAEGVGRHGPEVERTVYFCCLEALDNVERHAPGSRADVTLSEHDGQLDFSVRDHGPGFDPTGVPRGGLQHAADRLGAMGGQLVINSGPDGTVVRGSLPLEDHGRSTPG